MKCNADTIILTLLKTKNQRSGFLQNIKVTLTGVAQWIEHRPSNQRVTGSIPSQGIRLGCRPGPQ